MRKIFVLFFVMMVVLEAIASTKETKEHMKKTVLVNVNTPEAEKFPWMKRFMNQMVNKFRTLHGDKLKYYDSRMVKDARASPGKEKQYLRAHRRHHLEELDHQQRKEYQRTQAYYEKYGFPKGTKMVYRVPKEMPLPLEDF